MPRAKRVVELPEYLSACRRMLRAAGRRAGQADPDQLAQLVTLRAELDAVIGQAVAALRDPALAENTNRPPYSWAEIASELGTTRQAAQQRYGKVAA